MPTAARRSDSADGAMALSAAILLAGALWAIWLMVPWEPRIFGHEPRDSAYVIFSHIAFANGEPWGTVALHTSGPLGFLRFPFFYAPTYVWLLIGNAAIAATAALLLDYLATSRLRSWARLPFVAGAIWVLALSDDGVWLFLLLVSQLVSCL
jgi:hypothetical protein